MTDETDETKAAQVAALDDWGMAARAAAPWSGAGRALQEHLAMFQRAQVTHRWLEAHHNRTTNQADFRATMERDYWLRFAKTYTRYGLHDGVSQSLFREPDDSILWTEGNVLQAVKLMSMEYTMLDEAVTYYVSDRITDLVGAAAKTAEPEALFTTDMPTKAGFVVFERPWTLMDLHPTSAKVMMDLKVPIRAMGWTHQRVSELSNPHDVGEGVVLYFYTDGQTYQDIYVPELNRLKLNDSMGAESLAPRIPGLMALDVMPWKFGRQWRPAMPEEMLDDDGELRSDLDLNRDHMVVYNVGAARVWALTFFRLMWQELVLSDMWRPSRAERRRWDRLDHSMPEDGGVKVLRLRKIARPADEHFDHEADETDERRWKLDYRYPVRPHWRRQHYATLGPARLDDGSMNPESHRLIYIDEQIRGPEWGPLIERHNITTVTR